MTTADAKEFLKGYATGIVAAQLDKVAQVALDVGYASVWGAHDWKFKRVLKPSAMVTNQAYTDLPPDFESMLAMLRVTNLARPRFIDIKGEETFDYDHPYPLADNKEMPSEAKIVLHNGTTWRIYWWPIPNAAYTIEYPYNRMADTAVFPTLPSYMLAAVLEKAKAIMQGTADKTFTQSQVAERELSRAIMSDGAVKGFVPTMTVDVGYDDGFNGRSGGGSVWDPRP